MTPRQRTRAVRQCCVLLLAALYFVLAPAASAHVPGGKTLELGHRTIENAVGPIYFSEPLTDVWKTLGKATPSRRCSIGPGCRAVRYTDGQHLLVLDYDEAAYPGVAWIRVFAHARSRDAAKLPASIAPLSAWRWRGAYILRLPPPRMISGWTTGGYGMNTSFSYGHGCLTAFDSNRAQPRFMFFCE